MARIMGIADSPKAVRRYSVQSGTKEQDLEIANFVVAKFHEMNEK